MIKTILEKIMSREDLSIGESYEIMKTIMRGGLNTSHLAGLLIALKAKGESRNEIAGFASAMRDDSIKIEADLNNTIDVCGTGGDSSGTFNISTATAFVVAATGVNVAKHGNRSISSKCGSADVLQELGINISLSPELSAKALHEIGITFLFAPDYHPAMKHAAPVRKELGMKTIFNMLGPLTNPTGVKKQLIGTFNSHAARVMCEAAPLLGYEKVCFVCAEDSFDEISLSLPTMVFEYDEALGTKEYIIDHNTFSYPHIPVADILGDTAKINAEIITNVFTKKKRDSAFYIVAANSAMALYTAKYSPDLNECKKAAEDSILSGKAYNTLCQLRDYTA